VIGLDTNVLVRYVVQDDPLQSRAATEVIEGLGEDRPGFVSLVVVVELYWVLSRAYKVSVDQTAQVIRTLLDSVEIAVQESDSVRRALDRLPDGDSADALIVDLGRSAGCEHTVTFDRNATRLPGMRLLVHPA
jgi:predicted nucleic-acid-binding protein